jgi:hypothetical protein
MAEDSPDFLSEHGARELAYRITAYWADRGCTVHVRLEKVERAPHGLATIWAVRSDLGLYLPSRSRPRALDPGPLTNASR